MNEQTDVFADQFQVNLGPFGAVLNFMVTHPVPPAPGTVPQSNRVATIRTNIEHLKVIAFMLRAQIIQYERQTGARVEVPRDVLNELRIAAEDWEGFWRHPSA